MGVQGVAVPRFRPSVLLEGRQRAQLTQLELATLAEEAARAARQPVSKGDPAEERTRRVSAWESRIGAWERGIDSPSATYIPDERGHRDDQAEVRRVDYAEAAEAAEAAEDGEPDVAEARAGEAPADGEDHAGSAYAH